MVVVVVVAVGNAFRKMVEVEAVVGNPFYRPMVPYPMDLRSMVEVVVAFPMVLCPKDLRRMVEVVEVGNAFRKMVVEVVFPMVLYPMDRRHMVEVVVVFPMVPFHMVVNLLCRTCV